MLAGLITALGAVTAPAQADVTTVSVDSFRTGWDPEQPTLAPSDVTAQDFGQLFATQLDGQVYAQPVIAKNTLLAVTENNKAYGLDPVSGAVRWSRDIGPAWSVAPIGCGDLVPNVGVTATPVVDPTTGTAWFTAKVDDAANPDHPRWELHALDTTNGVERTGFPVTVSGYPDNDPSTPFAPRTQLSRPGLLLMGGVVYFAFGSHCDVAPFKGYVMGYDATTGQRRAMWAAQVGRNDGAGVWHAGGGIVSDGAGRIIVATGNGISPARGPGKTPPANLAESVIRLQVQGDGTLGATDFFSPVNNTNLDTDDTDLGSGGPVALPDAAGTAEHPHLLVQSGKDGRVFLLDRDDLGGVGQGPGGTDATLQTLGPYRGVWGHPAYWGGDGGYVYFTTNQGPLSAFKLGTSADGQPLLSRTGTSVSNFGYTSGSPVVTSNGTTSGSALVWVVYSGSASGLGGQLRAYDAVPVNGTLTLRYSVPIGTATKFAVPAVDGGRVYVAGRNGQVYGFGRPTSIPLTGSPTDFGLVAVGASSSRQVRVTAKRTLTVSGVTTSSPFGVTTSGLPRTLAAGSTLTVPITFTPTSAGASSGALGFTTSEGSYAFDVHGYGTKPGLAADPATLDFGEVPVGGTMTASINVTNTTATTTRLTGATAPAAPFGAPSLPRAGLLMTTGASVSVPVSFSPSSAGTFTSRLTVSSEAGSVTVPVRGKAVSGAPSLALAPTKVDFGTVAVGATSTKSFTISNAGNLVLTLTKAAPPTAPFLVPAPVSEGQQLVPEQTINQSVTFAPTSAGTFAGSYTITGNDGQGPQQVTFSGRAVPSSRSGPVKGLGSRCVDVRHNNPADGTPVQLFTCNQSGAQTWTVYPDGRVRALGRCLATSAVPAVRGSKVQIMTCDGSTSQRWTQPGDGSGALVNVASGLCLDVPWGVSTNNVQLQVFTCNGSAAQRWSLPT